MVRVMTVGHRGGHAPRRTLQLGQSDGGTGDKPETQGPHSDDKLTTVNDNVGKGDISPPSTPSKCDCQQSKVTAPTYTYQPSAQFYERFVCLVCWYPKLRMVYGACQHRVCEDCLYRGKDELDPNFVNCPSCLMPNSFPARRPCIPEDNMDLERCVGVTECPVSECRLSMWIWELQDHTNECHKDLVKKEDKPDTKLGRGRPRKSANLSKPKKSTGDEPRVARNPRTQRGAAREARLRCISMI